MWAKKMMSLETGTLGFDFLEPIIYAMLKFSYLFNSSILIHIMLKLMKIASVNPPHHLIKLDSLELTISSSSVKTKQKNLTCMCTCQGHLTISPHITAY